MQIGRIWSEKRGPHLDGLKRIHHASIKAIHRLTSSPPRPARARDIGAPNSLTHPRAWPADETRPWGRVPCDGDSSEMCSGSEEGSHLRLIDCCITQL